MPEKVAIVGLFLKKKDAAITQASELANLLRTKGYDVITVSGYQNKWLRILDIIFTLFRKRAAYNIAIVQFYSGKSFIWQYAAATIAKWLNKKLVFTVHGGGVPDKIKTKGEKYLALLRKADAVTAPSGYIIDVLKQYNINPQLVENTVRLQNYPFVKKQNIRPRLLWMRAFSDIYNPFMAVRLVAELKKKYPDVRLFMGGVDFGLLQQTKALANELNVSEYIEFVGFMDLEMKKHYAEKADIYISTNSIDNAPVTFLEMWALGLPVVSTNVGGIPYLIKNNEDGILVEDNDHVDMAEKISLLVEDSEKANDIINNGRTSVMSYDEEVVFTKWDKILTT
ncbi:MAG: glycosyltransferase family 4 protein [Bacteroidetes bacterium]|nr:glycosyltransferase family 4 protein [Bacteroidota bacterium]